MFFVKHYNHILKIFSMQCILFLPTNHHSVDKKWRIVSIVRGCEKVFSKAWDRISNVDAQYILGRGQSRQSSVTMEHHYRFDISWLQELILRFNEQTMELLTLDKTLDPNNNYKAFNIDHICRIVESFCSHDFIN